MQMTGTKKKRGKEYNNNWGGARPGSGPKPYLTPDQRKHTKNFWVTDAEAEALTKFLWELRNGKPAEEE